MDLQGFVNSLETVAEKFRSFGLYDPIKYDVEMLNAQTDPALDLKATLHLNRAKKQVFNLQSLTRNGEQGGFVAQGNFENLFGGAETLTIIGGADFPPNSLQSAGLRSQVPVLNSHKFGLGINTDWRSMDLPWASHSQDLSNASVKFLISNILGSRFGGGDASFGVEVSSRNVHSLKSAASDSVRVDSGQSLKTSLTADWGIDTTNDIYYPTKGVKLSANAEYATQPTTNIPSNVSFFKAITQGSISKTLDPIKDRLVVEVTGGSGLLWAKNSSIVDRFYLGGPKSGIYGYQNNGLGPKDLDDAIGGDGYIKGSLNVYGKLPRVQNSPLRFMLFFNGATLSPVDINSEKPLKPILESPSTGAGVGLCYRTEAAQLELTYSVPLSTREHDITRKGLQFGVGISLP